jgi:hypothetical protein
MTETSNADTSLQRAWDALWAEVSHIPQEKRDVALEALWASKRPPSLASFLGEEVPAKRRRMMEPVASLFQEAPTEVTALLPYAPEDLACMVC